MRGVRRILFILSAISSLAACSGSPGTPTGPLLDRVRIAGYSIEVPRGAGWQVETFGDRVEFHRSKNSLWMDTGSTLIRVSAHPVRPSWRLLSESKIADQVLDEAEVDLYRERWSGLEVADLRKELKSRGGKPLYTMTYRTIVRQPSEDEIWAEESWESSAVLGVLFPEGFREGRFFTFLIRDTNRKGSPGSPSTLLLINSMIDSFRREEPPAPPRPHEGNRRVLD
jgi:hypothetical protein